ncbi:MAG: MMPL family transporter [Salana multivorans]|uniref:MMPL family transporter n=1 Tax=Salana multivorans TaxID=120377 RepID=UPI0009667B32|nr:MMPL family transporter [Salana multivorans]MBN8882531.1 MMPL family transporter [Salana multivorans]OJX94377.1 MAG: hypothetical protein BGO96_15895 [Micrococcales bacterium 73-15]
MFARLGRLVTRRPLWVLAAWVLIAGLLAAAAMTGLGGTPLFQKLETDQPTVPGSQSERVSELMRASADGASIVLMVEGADLADTDAVAATGDVLTATRDDLAALDGVAEVTDPYQHPLGPTQPEVAALVDTATGSFLVQVTLDADLPSDREKEVGGEVEERLTALGTELRDDDLATGSLITSSAILVREFNEQMESDLVRGELVALPISLLVMVVVFGGALAAGMPIVGAVASIGAGLGSIWSLSYVMDLDSVVINVVTLLGLGLSIDYGLLMVSRFREELKELVDEQTAAITAGIAVGKRRRGGRRRDALVVRAVERTVATAGRTVTFSALTIAICVAGLIAMSPSLLKGLGVAGSVIVVIALLTAITLVPALLTLSGRRFLRPSVLSRIPGLRRVVGRLGDVAPRRGVFSALATWVQRYPWPVLIGCLAILVTAMVPLGSLHLRNSGIDALPADAPARVAIDTINERFPGTASADLFVVPEDSAADDATLDSVAAGLEGLAGVASVDPAAPLDDGDGHVMIGVHLADDVEPDSPAAVELVREIRDRDLGTPVLVGGQAAGQADFTDALVRGLPVAGGMVLIATFVLLFLMTGSVLVPVKALLTNAISIAASLGITTWVFQMGHGASLLGFTAAGGLESYVVAIVVAFGFGLAMDYEVFLIARIKELYDTGVGNDEAVVVGLQRSGRIITSAALVIIVVFAGFASGDLLPIKEAGFALAVAVALDATLVRMLLVPATMTVLGEANWWAPRWLRPLANRFAIAH